MEEGAQEGAPQAPGANTGTRRDDLWGCAGRAAEHGACDPPGNVNVNVNVNIQEKRKQQKEDEKGAEEDEKGQKDEKAGAEAQEKR